MEYSARIDWQINNNIKQGLVKRWIDVTKLRLNTTVRDIQWRLNNWRKVGRRWNPSKEMEKKLQKK